MVSFKWFLPSAVAAAMSLSIISTVPTEADAKGPVAKKVYYEEQLQQTAAYNYSLLANAKDLTGSYEAVTSFARLQYPVAKNFYTNYYKSVETQLKSTNGQLSTMSAGQLGKVIVAISAINKDPKNVANYNLIDLLGDKLAKGIKDNSLSNSDYIYALIALDSKNYDFSSKEQYKELSRENLVKALVGEQNEAGAFPFGRTGEDAERYYGTDMTAMALTALSNYNTEKEVKQVVRKGLDYISAQLNSNGGFTDWTSNNADTQAQVILSLTENGLNPRTSASFIKPKGNWAISNILLNFDAKTGGYKSEPKGTELSNFTANSALFALTAYKRYADEKPTYYDLSDATSKNLKYDTTAPTLLKVNALTNVQKSVKGVTEGLATVNFVVNKKSIGEVKADINGLFTFKPTKAFKGNSNVQVYVTDLANNKSKAFTFKVADKLTPAAPKVTKVVAGQKKVTGTAVKGAKVTVKIGKKTYASLASKKTGKFSVKVPTQKRGTKLVVKAIKSSYSSKAVIITVKK